MASALWNPGISPSNPTLEIIVNQQSQSTEGNYSVLAWSLVLHRPSYVSSGSLKNYNAIINNVTVASGSTTIGGSGDKLIASGTTVVYHNPDGNKIDVPFSFYMDIGLLWSNVQTGNASGSSDIDLTPIPRATTPSLNYSTREMGQVIRITTNPAVAGFSHKIYYSFTGIGKTLIAEKPAGNQYHDWIIPLATLAPMIPNSLSGAVTIEVETYNGTTLIGTKTVLFTATVPDYQPSASLVVTGVDLYLTRYVQGKSKVAIAITAGGLNGSTIATYRTVVNGSIYNMANLTTEVLASSGVNVIETTVTDSRGKTRVITQNITVEAYQSPQAISLNVARCLVNGTLDEEGGYVKATIQAAISTILNTNTKQTLVKYKLKASGTWTTALTNTTDYSVSASVIFPADTNSQFDVLLEVNDYFNTGVVKRSADVAVAFTLMDFHSNGKGIAIGKVAEGNGVLDIRGDTYTEGNVNVQGDLNLEGNANLNGVTNALGLISAVAGMNLSAPIVPMRIRYIRDYASQNSANASKHWCEIAGYTLNRAINRCNARPVTGSATLTNGAYITNGSANTTQYAEIVATGLQYVQIDLGAVYTDLAEIVVWHYFGDNRWYGGHKIEVSEDGITWIKIYDVANTGERTEISDGISVKIPNTKPILIGGGGTNKMEYIGYVNGTSDILINNKPLVQSGVNALGTWVRYYDGTQLCYGKGTTVNSGAGHIIPMPNLFRDNGFATMLCANGIASASASASYVGECYSVSRNTMAGKVLIHYGNTMANPGDTGVNWTANGRWY